MRGAWVEHLGGQLHSLRHPGDVLATVEHTPTGWHAYVSEPSCNWSYSETFTDQATALSAADTAAAWRQANNTEFPTS